MFAITKIMLGSALPLFIFLCIEFLNIGRQKKGPTIENHLSIRPCV